jgi:zinc and cadmium transporter
MTHPAISSVLLLAIYCALVLLASLAGGWFLLFLRPTHSRLQIAISFVSGLMLGIALLHFLPDADEQLHSIDRVVAWLMGGFLTMFFVQRFFHFHHHDVPEGDPEDCCHGDNPDEMVRADVQAAAHQHEHEQGRAHDHDHDHTHESHHHAHTLAEKSAQHLSWVGTALGLTLHSLLDGVALAAAVEAGARGHLKFAGLGVALVVILHKPFDAMAVSALMAVSGSSRFLRHLLNGLFALVSPIGAAMFYLGASQFAGANAAFLGCALAFCAGTFLCIASSDLLPELQFHSHDRFKLSVALLAGLTVAILIKQFEAAADQPPAPAAPTQASLAFPDWL